MALDPMQFPLEWTGPVPSVDEAYAYCLRMSRSHYENFPVASRILGRKRQRHVAAVYGFARTADDLADEPDYPKAGLTPDERLRNLGIWKSNLDGAFAGTATHPVFVALAATAKELSIPRSLFDDLLSAFGQDVVKARYESMDEVRDYARRSANPVGRLVLRIWGYSDARLDRCSDSICTALQLVNFWQDVEKDLRERDRIYVPRDRMAAHGVSEADLAAGAATEGFRSLMDELTRTACRLFDEGRPLASELRWPLSFWIRWVWLGGVTIASKLRSGGYDVFRNRPYLNGRDMLRLLFRSFLPLGSRTALPPAPAGAATGGAPA